MLLEKNLKLLKGMNYFKTWLNVDILIYKCQNCRLSTGYIFVHYTLSLRQIVTLPITFNVNIKGKSGKVK